MEEMGLSMFRIASFFALILANLHANGQQDSLFNRINNNTISYHVAMVGPRFDGDRLQPAKYLIHVDKQENDSFFVRRITAHEWLKALNDANTDWAANLLLYELYKRRALVLVNLKRSDWIGKLKEQDIIYWNSRLNEQFLPT